MPSGCAGCPVHHAMIAIASPTERYVTYSDVVDFVGHAIEAAGIAAVVLGMAVASVLYLLRRQGDEMVAYRVLRERLGRAILLGLEFLVAGDIIGTVTAKPNFTTVGVLAAIVLIRSFLSMELEMEIEGRWPWQRKESAVQSAARADQARREAQNRDSAAPAASPASDGNGRTPAAHS
jgi:uncharacterized membrane protein